MPSESPSTLFVYTTVASEEDARRLAEHVIGERAAACVSIGAPVQSVFRWEPESEAKTEPASHAGVQSEREIPLVIKTSARAYPRLERVIQAAHPYELPEIVAVPIQRGLPAFLSWIEEAVAEPD
ncbi:MAG: divalent-cation tolerance protein CutA [Deltaproteobacteria bacterium]|jgi:periplasmic divalent cation tolerance protein|nr:divalent-cation tolerance protein CutA [Deltaproteobacteria bacterium]